MYSTIKFFGKRTFYPWNGCLKEDLEQCQPSKSLHPVLSQPLIPTLQVTTTRTSIITQLAAVKRRRNGIIRSIFFIMNNVAMSLPVHVAWYPCKWGFLGWIEPGLELLGHSIYVGSSPAVNGSFPKELNQFLSHKQHVTIWLLHIL